MTLEIPDRLVRAILFARGEVSGTAWLKVLPRRVDLYVQRWNLAPLGIADGGAMSCCLFCSTGDGTEAVLKIPFDAASGRLESRSLKRWGAVGASPIVMETAPASGVFLMSRIRPGTIAEPANDPADSARLVELLARMVQPGLEPLRGLKTIYDVVKTRFEWAYERFADPGYEAQSALMPGVEALVSVLYQTQCRNTVIHGDLQQKNVLNGSDGVWQIIDPMTCRGDINADAALWAVVQDDGSSIDQRVAELSASDLLERSRLEAWCYVIGVAEYRTYQPGVAARINEFVVRRDWRELATAVGN